MKVFFTFLLMSHFGFGQSEMGFIRGKIVDTDGVPVPLARIRVFVSDSIEAGIFGGTESDFDGKFILHSLKEGFYDLEISNEIERMHTVYLTRVEVKAERITFLDDIRLTYNEDMDYRLWCPSYEPKLIDPFGAPRTIEAEEIRRL